MTYPTSTSSYRLRLKHLYANGFLQQVKDDNASTVFWQANATDFRGQVSQQTLGNNVITYRAFDAVTGRISTIQSGVGGGSGLQNESYLTDLVGNVTQRQQNNLGLTEDFFYDNVYRLTQSKLNTVTNLTVAYNAMGNITSRSDVAGGATWTYDATKKHAVTQAGSASYTYTYDANGNAQTRNGNAITWSKYNYPTVINGPGKTLTFEYDANNQRFRQTYTNGSLTETTMYVGGLLEKVTVNTQVDWRHYIKVGTQTIAVMSRQSTGTNATRYVLEDPQGSVANITDNTGASYVAESFTAFGARRNPATWSGPCPCPDLAKIAGVSRMGYTGHEAIGGISMGLNHMNGRVQDAITGRFLSADPYTSKPGNTQSFNRYSYVYNNPLSFTDPTGFYGCLTAEDAYYCGGGSGGGSDIDEIIVTGSREWEYPDWSNTGSNLFGDFGNSFDSGGGGGGGDGGSGDTGNGAPAGSATPQEPSSQPIGQPQENSFPIKDAVCSPMGRSTIAGIVAGATYGAIAGKGPASIQGAVIGAVAGGVVGAYSSNNRLTQTQLVVGLVAFGGAAAMAGGAGRMGTIGGAFGEVANAGMSDISSRSGQIFASAVIGGGMEYLSSGNALRGGAAGTAAYAASQFTSFALNKFCRP